MLRIKIDQQRVFSFCMPRWSICPTYSLTRSNWFIMHTHIHTHMHTSEVSAEKLRNIWLNKYSRYYLLQRTQITFLANFIVKILNLYRNRNKEKKLSRSKKYPTVAWIAVFWIFHDLYVKKKTIKLNYVLCLIVSLKSLLRDFYLEPKSAAMNFYLSENSFICDGSKITPVLCCGFTV